jgi:ribosomal protein L3 glutamine methyltransferase
MRNPARGDLVTVRDLLRLAVSRFNAAGLHFGHGSDNAYDEAAYLVLHTLHLPLDRLEPFLDARLMPGEIAKVLRMVERRVKERLPAAYLTREAWLADHRFFVDKRVIVPRSHIAGLLAEQLAPWLPDPSMVRKALDLCTGSGCLAILLALAFPEARVDASDISATALQVARRNIRDYGLADRVRAVRSDLFDGLARERYDLIVSNPPYVTADAMRRLPAEYRHEPRGALAAGRDGLDIVRRILARAHSQLNEGGLLIVEVGDNRKGVETAFPQLAPTWLETPGGADFVFLLSREQLPVASRRARSLDSASRG